MLLARLSEDEVLVLESGYLTTLYSCDDCQRRELRGLGCGPLKEPGKQMSSILDAQFRTYGEMKPLEVS